MYLSRFNSQIRAEATLGLATTPNEKQKCIFLICGGFSEPPLGDSVEYIKIKRKDAISQGAKCLDILQAIGEWF